jgi:hypothetical protein
MEGNESKGLNNRQMKSLPLLISAKTVQEGCKKAGISAKTYYEWMKDPLFKEELTKQQNAISDKAISTLRASMEKALNVLVSLLDSKTESTRRLAATDLLAHGMRLRELEEIESRLSGVERIILQRETYR